MGYRGQEQPPPAPARLPSRRETRIRKARALRWLLVAVGLAATSCRSPEPATAESVDAAAARERREPSLLDRLPMTPKQRAKTNELVDALRADFVPYNEVRARIIDEVIVQVRIGQLDRSKLDPLVTESIARYRQAKPKLMAFADELHATLNQRQREQLMQLSDDDDGEELDAAEEQQREQEELLEQLDLTAAQKTRLYPTLLALALRYWGPIARYRGGIREAREAFVTEDFRAAELAVFDDLPLEELADAVFAMLAATLAVLQPQQRQTLAAVIEARLR